MKVVSDVLLLSCLHDFGLRVTAEAGQALACKEDFARFQDSQNTRKAYLAEAAELAYLGRSGGEWGLGLTD